MSPAAHPAVVASPQGSTCPRQEITLQTCPLTLQICPSSTGVLPGQDCHSARYSCAVLPFGVCITRDGPSRRINPGGDSQQTDEGLSRHLPFPDSYRRESGTQSR